MFIRSTEDLAEYLRARGVSYFRHPESLSIDVDIGRAAVFDINVYWLQNQVRFIAVSPLNFGDMGVEEAALAVEQLNWDIGFPVWRVLPTLGATYTATLDHDGALSSRILEYAIALLSDALRRDQTTMVEKLGWRWP